MPNRLQLLLVLLGAAALGGCSSATPAAQVAQNGGLYNKFVPADKTTIVGSAKWVDMKSGIAVVELNCPPFSEGNFLVARESADTPTAVLETTRRASTNGFQGVIVVSGTLDEKEEIVQPGPELAKMVQENIDAYLVAHPDPSATAAPAAPTASAPPTTELPPPTPAPAPAP